MHAANILTIGPICDCKIQIVCSFYVNTKIEISYVIMLL